MEQTGTTIDASAAQTRAPRSERCPKCGASMPVNPSFVTWCDACGWNVRPLPKTAPPGRLQKLYLSLGDRLGKGLRDELIRAASLRPRLTIEGCIAFAIACLVHGLTLAVALAGVWMIVDNWPRIFAMLLGAALVGLAVLLRPRLGKLPREVLTREQAPLLYRLTDRVADSLHSPRLDGIVIDANYNAGFAQVGLRRKRILYLGMPFLAAFDGQELVGLLGHELAHGVNGDPVRSLFVGSAVRALFTWQELLWTVNFADGNTARHGGIFGLLVYVVSIVTSVVCKALSFIPLGAGYVLIHLLWRDSQRAEYYADALGAQTSGTSAFVAGLGKAELYNTFNVSLGCVAQDSSKIPHRVFDEFRERLVAIPPRELDRVQRALKLEQARLDVTHPPAGYRLALLQAHPCATAKVTCSSSEYAAIYRELDPQQQEIQVQLLDRYPGYWTR